MTEPKLTNEPVQPAVVGLLETPVRQHTPGPWTYFYKHKYDEHHVSLPLAGQTMKLALFEDGCPSERPEADARLIAAAPDLLAACMEVANGYSTRGAEMARLAIAKAVGCAA